MSPDDVFCIGLQILLNSYNNFIIDAVFVVSCYKNKGENIAATSKGF